MRSLAVIPARGGSRRIPYKNIRPFFDKPVIDYTIEAAKTTGLFERMIVSTDDNRIGGHVSKLGCIYYKRPAELALDHVPMVDVVIDVLRAEGSAGLQYDYVCMLYACSPFIKSESIVEGYKLLGKGFDVACPVFRGPHLERALLRRGDRMLSRFPEYDEERSNMWPDSYYHAGQFFWARRTTLLVHHTFMQENMAGVIIPEPEAVDIDEPEDWGLAEFKYQMLRGKA